MKLLTLFFFFLFSLPYLSAQSVEESVCKKRTFGTNTVWVYDKKKCSISSRIIISINGLSYELWNSNTDSLFGEKKSIYITNIEYNKNNKSLSVIYFSSGHKRRYMPAWGRFTCIEQNDTLIWIPKHYELPVKADNLSHEKTYLVNTDMVVTYYSSLQYPIIYIIGRKGELLEYRDGKVVDENTVPYRTPFKPRIPESLQQDSKTDPDKH